VEELGVSAASGFVEPELQDEFPGLRLDWLTVEAHDGRSTSGIRKRLDGLSNRFRGMSVISMRTQPIPRAYRTFFRHIGLDPDATMVPAEAAAVVRLRDGGFRSTGLLRDALLVALVETGVPVWALDADHVDAGGLGIRTTVEGDRLGTGELAGYLAPGRLAVVDRANVHSLLFGEVAGAHAVTKRTRHITLFSVAVEGVPVIHLEEALWLCVEVLSSGE
jgi:DNA/RNA-binding domain of Phe-tRNA-synthetase-like protein